MRWNRKVHGEWESWFAWYPITVHIEDSHVIIWLEEVERCLIHVDDWSTRTGYRDVWRYRDGK